MSAPRLPGSPFVAWPDLVSPLWASLQGKE